MKIWKTRIYTAIALLFVMSFWAVAQQGGGITTSIARHIYWGPSLPATCNPGSGDIFFKTTATVGINYCSATNTWSGIGAGSGTVTSAGIAGTANHISVSGTCTITTTGTCTIDLANNTALPGNPTAATQASTDNSTNIATTAYVTTAVTNAVNAAAGRDLVAAATATILPNNPTFTSVASGIGSFFTSSTNSVLVVDGYTPLLNDRILVKNQAAASNNGIYKVTQLGVASVTPWIMTRALDYDQPSDINNTLVPVANHGTVNSLTSWIMTATVATVDTDSINFTAFTPSGAQNAIIPNSATGAPTNNLPLTGWTAVNSAVRDDFASNVIAIQIPNNTSLNWRFIKKSLGSPGSSYTIYFQVYCYVTGFRSSATCDAGLTDGTKFENLEMLSQDTNGSGVNQLRIEDITNTTTDSATVFGPTISLSPYLIAGKIVEDGTHRTWSYWKDGAWVQALQVNTNTFLTPTDFVVGGLSVTALGSVNVTSGAGPIVVGGTNSFTYVELRYASCAACGW